MKKIIALLLVLCMLLALGACGSQTSEDASSQNDSAENDTGTANEESGTDTADAEDNTEEETPAEDSNPVNIIFASNKNASEDGGQVIQYFCDYVTEATNGEVTFEIFWGATMCSMAEELEMVSSGSAGMCALNQLAFSSVLPLTQFPNGTSNGVEGTVDYANYVLFDNEESATLIKAEFAANNLYYVGYSLNGSSGYYCNFEAYSLNDMAGKKFGTGKTGALEKAYGMSIVSMEGSAGYDSLQRAVVDCTDFTMGAAYSNSWQEVAKYWVYYGLCSFGNYLTINLDIWNSLTPEQQAIFEEAGQATLQFSIDQVNNSESSIVEEVENDYGVTVTFVEGEEQEAYAELRFQLDAENSYANAQEQGCEDDMKVVLGAAADFLGIDISDVIG